MSIITITAARISVIGVDCVPDEHCFVIPCEPTLSPMGSIFPFRHRRSYLVSVGTSLGDDIMLAAAPLSSRKNGGIDEYNADPTSGQGLQTKVTRTAEIMEMSTAVTPGKNWRSCLSW
jgi:hypothetical protein